jgi:hypothetical protein
MEFVEAIAGGEHSKTCQERATVIFEFVGSQSKIKANEGKAPRLIVVAVRNNQTGRYWDHGRILAKAVQYGVHVVRRFHELEVLDFEEMVSRVRQWKQREGVVVRFAGEHVVKVKTQWWFGEEVQPVRRWSNSAKKEVECKRAQKRKQHCETIAQRAVVTNAANSTRGMDVFKAIPVCAKVDLVYDRCHGHLSIVVMGFEEALTGERWRALQRMCTHQGWRLDQARSRRSVSSEEKVVETVYNQGIGKWED